MRNLNREQYHGRGVAADRGHAKCASQGDHEQPHSAPSTHLRAGSSSLSRNGSQALSSSPEPARRATGSGKSSFFYRIRWDSPNSLSHRVIADRTN